jgi:large subunit ribosomal protein L15
MPLQRRLPKRGFSNYLFRARYTVINLDRLQAAFGDQREISLDDIYARGLCPFGRAVKILGDGELTGAIKVEAHKFSKSAVEKIRKAGGEARELEVQADHAPAQADGVQG